MSGKTVAFIHFLTQSAINFRNLVETDNIYVYLGRSTPWDDELSPPDPTGCVRCEKNTRSNFILFKKLAMSETALATSKYTWELGTVYDEYVYDDPELFEKMFFVVTSSGNVYKCISNNDGAASTISPTGTSTQILITADGYHWKFMYNISATIAESFTNNNYLVIPQNEQKTSEQLLVESTAIETETSPVNGHGFNAALELFAKAIICNKVIQLQDSNLPTIEHRQVGIIINPLLTTGAPATADEYLISNEEIDTNSGILITKTHHQVISSLEETEETIQIVLQF